MCRPLARLLLTQFARRAPPALVTLLPGNTVLFNTMTGSSADGSDEQMFGAE
jgi:hypothetical protein